MVSTFRTLPASARTRPPRPFSFLGLVLFLGAHSVRIFARRLARTRTVWRMEATGT
ncbi:MAG: hypothetical protein R3E70_13665 [Burkholderiaceae bacterium]